MAQESTRRHVFISHHHADDDEVNKLSNLLSGAGYDIRNSSIRAKPANLRRLEQGLVSDKVIKRLLQIKIAWAGTTVVLIGKDTHNRPWVNWEIEQANKKGKNIVGIYVRGGTEADVPPALEKYANSIVAWNATSIMGAIDKTHITFQSADGTNRAPVHGRTALKC